MKIMARKKTSPSTQRRNAKRKEEFLKKKSLSPTSVKKYAEAVKKPAEASEKPAEAKEKPAEAKEKPAKAKEKPAEAKENHSEPLGNHAEAVVKPAEAMEKPVKAVENPAEEMVKTKEVQPWKQASKLKVTDEEARSIFRKCHACKNSRLPCAKHIYLL